MSARNSVGFERRDRYGLRANFQADLFDPLGNLVASITGTSQISRIQVERLE